MSQESLLAEQPPSECPHFSDPRNAWGAPFRSSKTFILFVVSVAIFTDTFLYTLIIPIIPNTLMERAGVPPNQVQEWISVLMSTHGTASLAASVMVGYLADRVASRRGPLLLGLGVLAASTSLYAFGTTPAILVVARALQGASGSIVHILGMALLTDTMGATKSGGSLGWQAIAMLAGIMLGPPLSGLVFDLAGHFAVFGLAYVVIGVDIFLRLAMIERKFLPQPPKSNMVSYGAIDCPGPASESISRVPTCNQEQNSTTLEEDIPQPKSSVVASKVLAKPGALALLANTRLLVALWAAVICAVLTTALESVLPLYTNDLFHWTPAQSGMLFMLLCPSFIIGPYVGRLTDRNGARMISAVGWLWSAFIWLAFCSITHDAARDQIMLSTLMLAFGFSSGLVFTPNMVEVALAVDEMAQESLGGFQTSDVIARAYSLHNIAYRVGSIVGPFWGGYLIRSQGWRDLCISFVAANAIGVGLSYAFSGGKREGRAGEGDQAV